MERRGSNYETMKRQMQAKFAASDLSQAAREWELESEGDCLTLTFAGRPYRIDRATGAVFSEQDGVLREADYNVSMAIFDILTRKRQHAAGTLMPVNSFFGLHSTTAASGSIFDRAARRFDHHDAELSAACERLGGIPYGKGDVGYVLPVFRDLRVAFQFWDSDEEFGPSLSLFCDGNILRYMHYETMIFMMVHILDQLADTFS